MSNSSYGKIILFRTEDLEINSIELTGISGESGVEDGETLTTSAAYFPFGASSTAASQVPGSLYQLPFNRLQGLENSIYRILSNNYKLENGAIKSERYKQFSLSTGEKLINFLYKLEGAGDKIDFYFLTLADGEDFYKGTQYAPVYEGSNYSFINHNLQISRPLTTGKVLTPEEILALPNDEYEGYDVSTQDFIQNLEKYGNGDILKVTPVYNYYLKEYETFNSSNPIALGPGPIEKTIPNFYYLLCLLSDKETYASVTPGTPTPSNMYSDNFRPEQINLILKSLSLTRFENSESDLLISPLGSELPTEIIQKEKDVFTERNSVVVLTSEYYKAFASLIEEQKKVYPFYNEIKIPVQKGGTVFRNILKKAKFYDQMQYRAAAQIKLINRFSLFGGNIDNLLTNYSIFYNTAVSNFFLYDNSKLGPLEQQRLPYESFNKKYGTGIIEFNLFINPNPDAKNLNFKDTANPYWLPFKNVSTIGKVSWEDYYNSSFLKLVKLETTPDELEALALGLDSPPGTDVSEGGSGFAINAGDLEKTFSNPLVFYANQDASENDYISNAIQNQSKEIFESITEFLKLDAFSVFDNVKNYSEILFFEVQKIDGETNNLIQTFILPNDPEVGSFVNYVDTQIKYGKGYIYKFYAHTISIGNNLRRLTPTQLNTAKYSLPAEINKSKELTEGLSPYGKKQSFDYDNLNNIKLIRVPYQNTEEVLSTQKSPTVTYNVDSPPVPPNVEFFPYKNINNKIGFWFNVGLGELKAKPIRALNTENEDLELSKYISENLNLSEGSKITFSTDDFGGKIQVYRVVSKPTSYADFKENKIADIDVVGPRTLVDDITPNQDYYYVFRHVDVHGLPSNPSPVYHLKMITDASNPEKGSVRVGVDGLSPVLFNELIYLSNESEAKIEEKTFKKYLLVERALRQNYLHFNTFETNPGGPKSHNTALDVKNKKNGLNIGSQDQTAVSINGKKFKIRVTSKQTGRKIDLNVDFKNLSVIENYEE